MKKVGQWHLTILTFYIFSSNLAYCNLQDTVRQNLRKQVSAIVDRFYYTNPDSAFYLLQEVENIAIKNKIPDLQLTVLLNKGWIAEHHRQIDSLYSSIQKGNKILTIHHTKLEKLDPDHSLRLEFMYMQGMYHYIVGDFLSSLSDFKKVIFQDGKLVIKDSLEAFDALSNIGQLYSSLQDHPQSLYYYGMARQVLPKKYPSYTLSARDYNYQLAFIDVSKAKTLSAQKKLVGLQNDQSEIIKTYQGALLKLKGKETKLEAQNLFLTIYHNLGEVYTAEKKIDSAIYWIKKSLKIIKKGDSEINIKTLLAAGRAYKEAGLYTPASTYLLQATVIAKKEYPNHHHHLKALVYYEQGQLEFSKKRWPEALAYYQQALNQVIDNASNNFYNVPQSTQSNSENELLKIIIAKAGTFYAWHKSLPSEKDKLVTAIAHYEFAVACVDNMKQTMQQEDSQQTFSSSLQSIYEKGISTTYEAYGAGLGEKYLEKSFFFMEKSKASSLLRATRGIAAQHIASVPTSVLNEEDFLKGKLYYWQHQLEKTTGPVEIQAIQKKILNVYEGYHTLINTIKKNHFSYYTLKYNMQVTSLQCVKEKLLNNHNAILEYYYGEKELYIFFLSKSKTIIQKVPIDPQFNIHFNKLLTLLKDGPVKSDNNSNTTIASRILYQYLVEPIRDEISPNTKKLLIIPSGLLGYLPFEILLPNAPNNLHEKILDLPYLFKSFVIGYEHSATLALEKKQRPSSDTHYAYLGFAPSYGAKTTNPVLASRGVNEISLENMPSLNFNRQEIEDASKHFLKSTNFYGLNATENAFKKHGTQSKIIHLSMHAILNNQNSLYSGLLFSSSNDKRRSDSTEKEDGFLHLYELYNLKLQADLAVLSACETGVGELSPGEGIISIGRAFQYAGCPAVAMSLWQVNDRSTSVLMKLFFENLSNGMAKDEALQQAKISFLQDVKNKHFINPHYWSAFIFVGNETPLKFQPFYTVTTLIVLAIILIDIGATVFIRKKTTTLFNRSLPI